MQTKLDREFIEGRQFEVQLIVDTRGRFSNTHKKVIKA